MKTTTSNNPMARVMSLRDFRLLFAGAATSLLGDQFSLIATPWGVHLAHTIPPIWLKRAFGAFLLITSLRMFWKLFT